MAHGRGVVGVALLLLLATTAAAQPAFPGGNLGVSSASGNSVGPVAPGPLPPSMQPTQPMPSAPARKPAAPAAPAAMPEFPSTPSAPAASPMPPMSHIHTLSALTPDHPPMKEIPSGLPDLIPPPEHGAHGFGKHGKHGGHGGHDAHGCGPCDEHDEIHGYLTPFIPEHGGWFFGGEFLLMRPRYTDFDYVIRSTAPGLAINGPIQSLKYGVGTGLRVEGGYRFGEGKWETAFAYTYFTSGDTSTVFAGNGVLLPTLTRPGLTDRALTAPADADLDYQLFDLLAARRLLLEENFAVRAIGGFRFADVRQTLNAFYDGLDARRAAVNTRSRFQGFGPLVGAEAVLVGWKGFHLYSRATAGLISGSSNNRVIETNDNRQTTYVNTSYDVRKVVPVGSIAIGGGWQYRTISLRAGYEVTHWQGIFERPRFVDDVSRGKVITRPGNLTLEGLFIQVGLSF